AQFGVSLLPALCRLGGLGAPGGLGARRLSCRGGFGSGAGRCHQGPEQTTTDNQTREPLHTKDSFRVASDVRRVEYTSRSQRACRACAALLTSGTNGTGANSHTVRSTLDAPQQRVQVGPLRPELAGQPPLEPEPQRRGLAEKDLCR